MIKTYTFEHEYDAEVEIKVDLEKFTQKMALNTLEFFSWYYDEENNPIDEVVRKYAIEAIRLSTINNYNINGVIRAFENNEGFYKVDGSMGIELVMVLGIELDEDYLTLIE